MSSDGVPAGLTGFRLWGFAGILVRRPGFWSSPFAGRAGEDGLAAGWFRGASGVPGGTNGLLGAGTVHPEEDRGPHLAFARCRRRAGGRFRMHRTNLPGCTRSLIRSGSLGYAAMGGSREVAEACRSAEHGARIAGPGPGACTGAAGALGGGCRTGLHVCCRARSSLGSRVIALSGSAGPLPDGGSSASRTCGVTLDHVA
jgi:hypothetical protein